MSAVPATPVKETKAQRAERLKRQKNPWECFEEIRRFALGGHATIPDEWLKTYLDQRFNKEDSTDLWNLLGEETIVPHLETITKRSRTRGRLATVLSHPYKRL